MRSLLKIGVGMLLLAFVLIGLSYSVLRAQGVSNPASAAGRSVRSEKRPVTMEVRSIDLNGPINLTLRQGANPSMRVRGEQRLLGNVDTTQEGSVLHIGTKGMLFHHRQPLQVELVLPVLEELEVHGSGDSSVNGFSGERFKLSLQGSGNVKFNGRFKHVEGSLAGSGDLNLNGGNSDSVTLELVGSGAITASGSAATLEASLTGSGDLDAEHLATDKTAVVLKGSGSATVFTKLEADLTLGGSGDVQVYGQPEQRRVTRSGSGEVKWR